MRRRSWNRMESIPINALSYKELKQAINDWAEGNRHLKKLLWTCYKNGVETSGCHSGHGRGTPYIDFRPDTTSRTKLKQLIVATLSLGNGQVFLTFNGNPRSGPDWHRPGVCMSPFMPKDTKKFLVGLCKAVEENAEIQDEAIENFLNIYEFMKDKETPLRFRIEVRDGEKYTISAECHLNNRDYDYYTELFAKAGMTPVMKPEWKGTHSDWVITVNGKEEFSIAMQKLYQTLVDNWTLNLPEEITEDMDERSEALLMRRKFGTDRQGIENLNQWLNEHKEYYMREVNY